MLGVDLMEKKRWWCDDANITPHSRHTMKQLVEKCDLWDHSLRRGEGSLGSWAHIDQTPGPILRSLPRPCELSRKLRQWNQQLTPSNKLCFWIFRYLFLPPFLVSPCMVWPSLPSNNENNCYSPPFPVSFYKNKFFSPQSPITMFIHNYSGCG